jgi:hypothetical protein
MSKSSGSREQRGQVLPLLALVMVVAGVATWWVGRIGAIVADRAEASAQADAAALAGAGGGERAARQVAGRNGGAIVTYESAGPDVRVRVRVGRASASARARRAGGPEAGTDNGSGASGDLAPAMRAALSRAEQLLGRPVPITSGYRSPTHQADLWAHRAGNPYPVAPPGASMHERGLAIDVPAGFVDTLLGVAADAGLCHPYPERDPIHFEVCPGPTVHG